MNKGRGEEGEGGINGESSTDACALTHVNRELTGTCCMTQGAQTGDL